MRNTRKPLAALQIAWAQAVMPGGTVSSRVAVAGPYAAQAFRGWRHSRCRGRVMCLGTRLVLFLAAYRFDGCCMAFSEKRYPLTLDLQICRFRRIPQPISLSDQQAIRGSRLKAVQAAMSTH